MLLFSAMMLEPIVYPVADRPFHGYIADGSRGRRVPGVLVAHDGPGLNAHTKERAALLADLGYVAFAPKIPSSPRSNAPLTGGG